MHGLFEVSAEAFPAVQIFYLYHPTEPEPTPTVDAACLCMS
jgi:hypothetical protein